MRKRDGYTAHLVGYSTVSVSSAFAFKNQAGDEILLFTNGSDVWRSANAGSATVLTTVTYQARLYCQNAEGTAYCFTSSNDLPWKYDGTTRTHTNATSQPNGKFNVFTQDRQLISGTTDQPNRLYIGKSASYQDFTGGNDLVSSWTEDVGTNGDRITALSYLNGRVIVWKEYSISGFNMTDQFSSVMYGISNDVGVAGPESLIQRGGAVYFKATDNEFYAIDGAPGNIRKLSVAISSTTAGLFSGKNRYNIQTEKADWDAGDTKAAGPGAPMATNIVAGSVMGSSVTFVDTSSSTFNLGVVTAGAAASVAGDLGYQTVTSTYAIRYDADVLPASDGWTKTVTGTASEAVAGSSLTVTRPTTSSMRYDKTIPSVSEGSVLMVFRSKISDGGATNVASNDFQFIRNVGNQVTGLVSMGSNGTVSYFKSASASVFTETSVTADFSTYTVVFTSAPAVFFWRNGIFKASATATEYSAGQYPDVIRVNFPEHGNASTIYSVLDFVHVATGTPTPEAIDIPRVSTFTSRIFDTGFSTPTMGTVTFSTVPIPSGTSIGYNLRSSTSPNNDLWGAFQSLTSLDRSTTTQTRYIQYQTTFSHSGLVEAPGIKEVTLIAATTGQYVTQCIQPGPGITAWGVIAAGGETNGNAGISYDLQTGNACSSLGTFTAISTGAAPSGAVKAALKIRTTFSLPSATNTARLDDLTVNWSEGSVSSPTYGTYWNNGLYWSVQISTGGNDRVLKYDLNHDEWFLFDIAANPLLTFNNVFYFGSSRPPGKMFKFSSYQASRAPTSDDGAAINAYWQSKNLTGPDPFVENSYDAVNLVLRKETGGSATVTWKANGGDSGSASYSVGLSTGTNAVRSNYRVPVGTRGTFFSFKVGNNSTTPFEMLGARIDFKPLPYRPMP